MTVSILLVLCNINLLAMEVAGFCGLPDISRDPPMAEKPIRVEEFFTSSPT
jgi:hypothetical protein